jgi:transposase InsO family protein
LYHLFTPQTKRLHRAYSVIKQLCIPTQYRRHIATELHDKVAHPGFDRVFPLARMRCYWPGLYTYLKDHVITCATCQKCKREIHPPTVPIGELPSALPMMRFHVDLFGPLLESDGKRFILVIVDSASQWPELIATYNLEAKTICEALFNNVVSRFGLPRSISVVSDNESGFTSALAETFAKTYGIKQCFTSPYHKQANSRAEHFGETIHKSLKILCEQQADWSKHLQAVAMYYRYSPTTNLGLSPFEIIYGRTVIQNLDWDLVASEPSVLGPQQCAYEKRPKLAVLHQIVLANARDSAQRHRGRVNENATIPTYEAGEKVLLSNPAIRMSDSAKLTSPFRGPFLVREIRPGYNYVLTDLITGKTLPRCVHAERLRVFWERDSKARKEETEICLFEGKAKHRLIMVKTVVADITSCTAGVLVNPTDS